MEKQFDEYIQNQELFDKTNHLLVAVSGGIDSMVLLNLLLKLNYKFSVAHCNFQLRGKESDQDEQFIKEYCESRNIPIYIQKFETQKFVDTNKMSIQVAARELRYSWFEDLCANFNFHSIVTAHNLNDQAETFFINVARGTGIAGLRGMKPANNLIKRPLLFSSRNQIQHYSSIYSIPFREDSSNASDKYLRNKLRHTIIPNLEEINKDFVQHLGKSMERLLQIETFYKRIINDTIQNMLTVEREKILISIDEIVKLKDFDLYLYEFLSQYDFNDSQIVDIKEVLKSEAGSKQFFSKSHRLLKSKNSLIIIPNTISIEEKEEKYLIDSQLDNLEFPLNLSFNKIQNLDFSISTSPNIAQLDFEKLSFPLNLRKWNIGDKFYPLGMSKSKKLSDFFIDQKFSLLEKEQIWVLCSDNDTIIWVVGQRIDNRFKVTEQTKEILKIEWNGIN